MVSGDRLVLKVRIKGRNRLLIVDIGEQLWVELWHVESREIDGDS